MIMMAFVMALPLVLTENILEHVQVLKIFNSLMPNTPLTFV